VIVAYMMHILAHILTEFAYFHAYFVSSRCEYFKQNICNRPVSLGNRSSTSNNDDSAHFYLLLAQHFYVLISHWLQRIIQMFLFHVFIIHLLVECNCCYGVKKTGICDFTTMVAVKQSTGLIAPRCTTLCPYLCPVLCDWWKTLP